MFCYLKQDKDDRLADSVLFFVKNTFSINEDVIDSEVGYSLNKECRVS